MFERSPNFGGVITDKTPPEEDEDGGSDADAMGGDDDGCFDMVFAPQYHNNSSENTVAIDEQISEDGKVVRRFQNGKKEVLFKKGV